MITKFSLSRLILTFLLVIIFPFVQNQWLNLHLFDINNFTIYKLLYYLSGVIVPIFVCLNSLNVFTNYKFSLKKISNKNNFTGKLLFLVTTIIIISLSTLITNYILLNINLVLNLINTNKFLVYFDISKQIYCVVLISALLIFKTIKLFIKKIILINFFIISIITWYMQLNNILLNDSLLVNNFLEIENINFINILILFGIESLYYFWSYISYGSYLSDWSVPKLTMNEVASITNIIFFYISIILYYSILSNTL